MSHEFHLQQRGLVFDITVEDITFSPGRPAKLNAMPEDCYPEEYPEIDYTITKIVQYFDDSEREIDELPSVVDTSELDEMVMQYFIDYIEKNFDEDTPKSYIRKIRRLR